MKIGIPCEQQEGETRVALTPGVLPLLLRDGHSVIVQTQAGAMAHFSDAQYAQVGASIVQTAEVVYEEADAIFRVQPPLINAAGEQQETDLLREGTILIGLLDPLAHPDLVAALEARRVTSYALELIPRISRAQGMDALTSMATVAGYKAVLLAADRLDKMFPLMMTAAGTIAPATVLVLGAGVAGLEAIATAKRLGAKVVAFDPRAVVRGQIQSLGATFLEMAVTEAVETAGGYAREQSDTFLESERATIAGQLSRVDVVICAAQVFGKRAPVLITVEMVEQMRPGAVIIDLAADQGGNCALTEPNRTVEHGGVIVIGAGNLPTLVPADASQLFARNVVNLFRYLYPVHGAPPDATDEIVRAACITRDGAIVSETVRAALTKGAAV